MGKIIDLRSTKPASRPRPVANGVNPLAEPFRRPFRRRVYPVAIIGLIVAVIVIIASFFIFKKDAAPAQAQWFNDDWHYRASFDVFNASTTEDLFEFQTALSTSTLGLKTLYTNGKLSGDFRDLRFTDASGNLLDYWFADATTTLNDVYVKMPKLPMNATSTVYMYYGNPSAADKRDGAKVFPDFFEDFSTGNYNGRRGWQLSSGAYTVAGADKYLQNSTAGIVYATSTKAYGTWEFDLYKGAADNVANVSFIDSNTNMVDAGAYRFLFNNNEAVGLAQTSIVTLFATAASYISNNTWYRIKIIRSASGEFTGYLNGTLINVAGGTGTNPATNTTYTTSNYWVLDFDASDRIDNLLWRQYVQTEPVVAATSGTSEETGPAPVGYWKFDEGYGTSARDSSSYKNNGTLTNMSTSGTSTAWVVGKVNKALQFDGSNDYINVPYNASLQPTDNITVSAWFLTNDKTVAQQRIISNTQLGGYSLVLNENSMCPSNMLSFLVNVAGTYYCADYPNSKLSNNTWYFVTGSYDGETVRLYVNGSEVAVNTAPSGQVQYTYDNPLCVSAEGTADACSGQYFKGALDEIKIYNYLLTASQIKAEYNKNKSVVLSQTQNDLQDVYNGLVGWWKMDESTTDWDGAGDRVNDYSGNGNNGTASGNAVATTTAKYGNAALFDGTDDFVTIPTGATLSGKSQATIEAWIKAEAFGEEGVVFGEETSTSQSSRLILRIATNGAIKFYYRDASQDPAGTVTTVTGNTTISANTWYHLAAVYNADSDVQEIYVNGSLDIRTSNKIDKLGASATNGIKIGAMPGGSANDFTGVIDDVKIYNLARTPDQIMQDYLQGPGPITYYDFEEGSGTTANDKSGQGYNGTITAGTGGWKKGKIGRAYDFDGANTAIVSSQTANTNFTSGFTISAWIKPDNKGEYQEGVGSGAGIIVSKNSNINGDGGILYSFSQGANVLVLGVNGSNFKSSGALTLGQWQHVIVTVTPNATVTHYVNGVVSGTPGTTNALSNITTGNNLCVGNRSGSGTCSTDRTFDGLIDDVKIYNYALTPWQVAQEYNQGKPLAQWSLDEGQGTSAYNAFATSTNALVGTLTNMSTTGTSTAWVSGKFGKALLFDGSNDTVAVTDNTGSGLDMTGAGSMSAWIKPSIVSGNKYIIDKAENTAYALRLTGSSLTGYFGNSSCSGGTVKANQWQYVSAAWDGAKIRCYIDGKEVASVAYSTALTPQDTSLYIGSDGGAASYFSGIIDEVKIYQYALSPAQIKKDYNDGLAVALSTSDGGQNAQAGLIGWYKMDESTTDWDGAGDRVNDYSGNGNHGTASGDAHATTTAKYGNAGSFDGTDDYVAIPSGATLAGKSQATIEAWMRADTFSQLACIYCEQTSDVGNVRIGFFVSDSGFPALIYRDSRQDPGGSQTTLTGSTALSVSTWYHLAVVYDADKDIKIIYINGVENKRSIIAMSGFGSSAANAIRVGDLNGSNEFDGLIDDVKVYSLARTPDQIMQDYLVGPGPIASYNFEEGRGTTLNDISGQGHNGTITAGASNGFVKGKIGRAYDFDGANTKIDTGSDWIGTSAISISAWLKLDSYGENSSGSILENGKLELIVSVYAPNGLRFIQMHLLWLI